MMDVGVGSAPQGVVFVVFGKEITPNVPCPLLPPEGLHCVKSGIDGNADVWLFIRMTREIYVKAKIFARKPEVVHSNELATTFAEGSIHMSGVF
ncbi:hypothetical protein CDAR_480311 [Caerostris darwini]|uniref:Uncharacterized protein n=1 Tax=Caerostris darwini TaxID=1538125 RepID=A0AAV4V0E8_9ARAC|nr:hypothetical protein CDAR_480311 [Caerostris darwini]